MMAIQLLLLSVSLYGAAALASLLVIQSNRTARGVSGWGGLAASLVGIIAAVLALVGGSSAPVSLYTLVPFGTLAVEMDGLSAFLVGIITLVGAATSLYSITSLDAYEEGSLGGLGFFNNLFMASMLLVVCITNAFYFLIFWELMTLASYFLVIFEDDKPGVVRAGYLYMLFAHAGAAMIMLAFLILASHAGSFDFAAFRGVSLTPVTAGIVFLLAFFGFGAKAGVMPLHVWMPSAYKVAPSHVSALLSGAMKKIALYGILRLCVDILGAEVSWWGGLVLAFGGISLILGVLYALTERDLKRMLAYSSIENVGIILIGIGTGMIGLANDKPLLASMGFLAALYHIANHASFKGLLFLGAGAIGYRLQTQDLNQMGGLTRRMPWTSLAFLTGTLAVSAIPPLNGFVSEWFTYQALFTASQSPTMVRGFAPLFALLLGLAGALAALCFMKAYGGAFSGPARSRAAEQAQEVPGGMLAGMGVLGVACLALGLGTPLVVPVLNRVVAGVIHTNVAPTTTSEVMMVSMPLITILLISLLVVPFILVAAYGGRRAGRRSAAEPWSCGYGYRTTMSATPGSFDQPVMLAFRPVYRLRDWMVPPLQAAVVFSRRAVTSILHFEPVVEETVSRPTIRFIETAGQWIQGLQMGDLRVYCFYIIVTLAILLILVFR